MAQPNTPPGTTALSVIIPVYNAQQDLRRCLDSIAAQTFRDMEVILVDDGSTDGSGDVCEEYAQKDARFGVIHKQNAGMGAAYNTGLKAARGRYVGFAETDDWVEPDMFEKLMEIALKQKVEVVKSLFYGHKDQKEQVINIFNTEFDGYEQVITQKFSAADFVLRHPSHWSAVYNREFLERNDIVFNESPGAAAQDHGFVFLVFCYLTTLYVTKRAFYHYNMENKGASSQQGYETAMKFAGEKFYVYDLIQKRKFAPEYVQLAAVALFIDCVFKLYYNCTTLKQKTNYLKRMSPLFKSYYGICGKSRFVSENELFRNIAFHPVRTALADFASSKAEKRT